MRHLNCSYLLARPRLFFVVGLFLLNYQVAFSGFALIIGDLGDTRFNHYILEHSFLWFKSLFSFLPSTALHGDFWSPPFFYPTPGVAAFSDVLLGVAPWYWLFRLLGLSPESSLQCWQQLVLSLNYLAFFSFAEFLYARLAVKHKGTCSALAAFVFAFASPRLVHASQIQFLPHFYSIWTLYFGLRFLLAAPHSANSEKNRTLLLAVLSYVLQWYSSFYYAWMLSLALAVFLFFALCSASLRQVLLNCCCREYWRLSAAVILIALLVLPMALKYYAVASALGLRDFYAVQEYLPRPQAWIFMGRESLLYSWLDNFALFRDLPYKHEQQLGLGFVSTILMLIGGRLAWKFSTGRALVCTAIALIALSVVGPTGRSLWSFVHLYIPGAAALRAVSRLGVVLLIAWALFYGLSFAVLAARTKYFYQKILLVIVFIFSLLEQGRLLPTYDKADQQRQHAVIAEALQDAHSVCDSFYYSSFRGRRQWWKYQLDAMWGSLLSGIPTINGYSGNFPRGWDLADCRWRKEKDLQRIGAALFSWVEANSLPPQRTCWLRRYEEEGKAVFQAFPLSSGKVFDR